MYLMKTTTNKADQIEALYALLDKECTLSTEKRSDWTDEDWAKEFRARDICHQMNALRD